MVRIKGWNKKINSNNRVYWENKERDMIANVEKVGSYWFFTKGSSKNQKTSKVLTKKEGIDRAIKYMKFHDY